MATTANTQPIYTGSVITGIARITNEVTPRKITTQNPVLLYTAGIYGGMVSSIQAKPLGDNVASSLYIYYKPDGVSTYYFIADVTLPAITGSTATTQLDPVIVNNLTEMIKGNGTNTPDRALYVAPNDSIYCALGVAVASGYDVLLTAGNY